MSKAPQRTVEAASIEQIGPISAQDLIKMSDDSWGVLRDRITDGRNGKDGLVAKCFACDSPVYIRTSKLQGVTRPLFQHFSGGDPNCPWFQGRNLDPDEVRAAQYQGKPESIFHRKMCMLVAELAALDPRYIRHTVDEYRPPTNNQHGRFPDIYVEWADYGAFAVEFQFSGTYQTEVSGRCKHYEREGMPLLWILFGIDSTGTLSQSFIDVIRRHRGNAFVLDYNAICASRKQRTIVLSCFLKNSSGGFDPPKLVRFDELIVPRTKLPYLEDRVVEPRLVRIKERRKPWFKALKSWQADRYKPLCGLDRSASLFVAAAFSMVETANGRGFRNYASEHLNLSAMLNTFLNSKQGLPQYADLISKLIENISIKNDLKASVFSHLKRCNGVPQKDEKSPEWQLLCELLPEALVPETRQFFLYFDALPDWVLKTGASSLEAPE